MFGNYVFAADTGNVLLSIDISDPASPRRVDAEGPACGAIEIEDALIYAMRSFFANVPDSILRTYSIAKPTAIRFVGQYKGTATYQGAAIIGNYAYLAYSGKGIAIIDVTIPSAPQFFCRDTTVGFGTDIAVSGGRVYLLTQSGLIILGVPTNGCPTPLLAYGCG